MAYLSLKMSFEVQSSSVWPRFPQMFFSKAGLGRPTPNHVSDRMLVQARSRASFSADAKIWHRSAKTLTKPVRLGSEIPQNKWILQKLIPQKMAVEELLSRTSLFEDLLTAPKRSRKTLRRHYVLGKCLSTTSKRGWRSKD